VGTPVHTTTLEAAVPRPRTLAVDFDGVVHAYSHGWRDGTIYDPPLPGALEGLRALMDRYAVYIHTTRRADDVAAWLRDRGFECRTEHDGEFWDERGVLLVTDRKLPAVAYLDDRAVRFTSWPEALDELLT
jgi:trehalose-6-phosphatase